MQSDKSYLKSLSEQDVQGFRNLGRLKGTTIPWHFLNRNARGILLFGTFVEVSFKHTLNNREKYTGSGMGLAICKKILSKYGEDIWIISEVGKGSTFHFTLPLTSSVASKSLQKM